MPSLLGFEIYVAMKQRLLMVLALLALGYGYFINSQPIGEGMAELALNSPYRNSYFLILVSILSTLVVALFTCNVLLKDDEHRFASIIGTLTHRSLFVSRWITIFLSSVLLSFCLMLGMLAALPTADPARVLPLHFGDVAWPWLVVVLPNTLLVSAFLIAVTTRWRSAKISYCCSLLLVCLAGAALIIIKAPLSGESLLSTSAWTPFLAIVEPFAASAFFEQTQFWLPQQKNQQWFQLSGYLLINRLWVGALTLLLIGYLWRQAKQIQPPRTRHTEIVRAANSAVWQHGAPAEMSAGVPASVTEGASVTRYWLSVLSLQVGFYTGQLLANWPIRMLLLLWWGVAMIGILMAAGVFSSNEFSGKYISSAGLIRQAGEAFGMFAQMLLVLVIAESIWQERDLKLSELIVSTPLPSTTSYLAKLISCMTIPLVMLMLMLGCCLVYQATFTDLGTDLGNDSGIEWYLYAVNSYYFLLPTLYQAVLIFFIQTLIAQKTAANKYLAIVVSAGVLIGVNQVLHTPGIGSPLWQLNQFPDLSRDYSALGGFAGYLEQFHLLALYWGAFALVIAILTLRRWLRQERIMQKRALTARAELSFFSAFVLFAAWLHWTLPAQVQLNSADVQLAARADYEKSYRAVAALPHPEFSQTSVTLDFYPEQRLVKIKAHNQITNYSSEPIHSILVTTKQPLQRISVETGRTATERSEGLWHTYWIELSQPMLPGANLTLKYSLELQSHSFAIDRGIVENGMYFHQGAFEPMLGYAAMLEIDDNFSRKAYGLAEKTSEMPALISQKRTFAATLSTANSQTALTSGELVRRWQQGGRTYYQYAMPQKIYPVVGYFSAAYQTQQWRAGGIPVTIYYHPQHQRNVAEIAKATTSTLQYMQKHFGDYPYGSLNLIEVPQYHAFGGRASAGVVALNESLFLQDYQDGAAINNVARNTIHEIAHQWFGEKLTPKIARGEKVLTESIAKAIEATVLGQMYGEAMQTSLMDYNLRRYQSGRAYAHQHEPSLLNVDQQEHITYGKGPIVLHKLQQHLGDDQYYAVLRDFIEQYQHDMQATLPELVKRFAGKSAAPDEVYRLFNEIGLAAQAK